MTSEYQARWISKQRSDWLKRTGKLGRAILLDSFNGFLIVEPVGSNLGDGDVLSAEAADYELTPVWCPGSKVRLAEARRQLGLDLAPVAGNLVGVG